MEETHDDGTYVQSQQQHQLKSIRSKSNNLVPIVRITKQQIATDFILTVEGYIRRHKIISINIQNLIDLILFFYAKPIIMNIQFQNQIKYVSFCPINGSWDSICDKIQFIFTLGPWPIYFNKLLKVTHPYYGDIGSSNCESFRWNEQDLFVLPDLCFHFDTFQTFDPSLKQQIFIKKELVQKTINWIIAIMQRIINKYPDGLTKIESDIDVQTMNELVHPRCIGKLIKWPNKWKIEKNAKEISLIDTALDRGLVDVILYLKQYWRFPVKKRQREILKHLQDNKQNSLM
eukprot:289885_1